MVEVQNSDPSSSSTTRQRSPSPPPVRSRLNSKDIPRTYSGLYGSGGELTHQTPNSDLLPFELSRNLNTDWLKQNNSFDHSNSGNNSSSYPYSVSSLLFTYIFFILLIQFTFMTLPIPIPIFTITFATSWTYTNLLHGIVTVIFLHWIKGSPNYYEQGELNAMTLWEQISSSPDSMGTMLHAKRAMVVVPTVLCYAACHFGKYERWLSLVNTVVWIVCVVAKLEGMNGVRVWGINRTIGIDDDLRKVD